MMGLVTLKGKVCVMMKNFYQGRSEGPRVQEEIWIKNEG